jgi:hypothetical protein
MKATYYRYFMNDDADDTDGAGDGGTGRDENNNFIVFILLKQNR